MEKQMSWCTRGLPQAQSIRFWRESLCEAVFELEVDIDRNQPLCGSIIQHQLGSMAVSLIELDCRQTIKRTEETISRSFKAQFEFVVIQRGSAQLIQRRKALTLEAGDAVLIDGREPYELQTQNLRNLSFHISAEWLETWIPKPAEISGTAIVGRSTWGRAINAMVLPLIQNRGECDDMTSQEVGELLRAAFARHDSEPRTLKSSSLLEHLRELVKTFAHDTSLDVPKLASLAGVSVRYVHKIFADVSSTFGAELLNARLNIAERLLADPLFNQLSISEIAWRAGFSDASHFSRRFKSKWHMTPGEIRKR